MISVHDLYTVLTAVVPLYVAMILAYGSVRWWRIFTPDQCSGINRFVAIFAVPLLSFHFISTNNPYAMNLRFLAADSLQKLLILFALFLWSRLSPSYASSSSLDWSITLFSLATLPNTLVMGIPLLIAMYGPYSGSLMVQIVVLQCIIWYTLLLFLFEFRGARILIADQFPDTAADIVSFRVDSDIVSLDAGRDMLQADTEIGGDGKIHVTVRKSTSSRRSVSMMTPRPSNLTGAEIYSVSSSRNPTPRGSNFNHSDFYAMVGGGAPAPPVRGSNFGSADLYSVQSSRGPTPRPSNYEEGGAYNQVESAAGSGKKVGKQQAAVSNGNHHDAKELHMFVWSSSGSPVSDVFGGSDADPEGAKEIRMIVPAADLPRNGGIMTTAAAAAAAAGNEECNMNRVDDFSFSGCEGPDGLTKLGSSSTAELQPKQDDNNRGALALALEGKPSQMPPASVMTRLILIMVWRKLIRNPNTYSSLIGLVWSLVAFR